MRSAFFFLILIIVSIGFGEEFHLKQRSVDSKIRKHSYHGQRVPTNIWTIQLSESISPHVFAEEHGLTFLRKVKGFNRMFVFRGPHTRHKDRIGDLEHKLSISSNVEYFAQQHEVQQIRRGHPHLHKPYGGRKTHQTDRKMSEFHSKEGNVATKHFRDHHSGQQSFQKKKRYAQHQNQHPQDPKYYKQWHLHGNDGAHIHVNAEKAWDAGYDGDGVILAIVDDGCNHRSPDLRSNYMSSLSWDYETDSSDPSPYTSDGHGTGAAGVCCAARNNVCGVGVAPKARLVCLKLISGPTTDLIESEALAHSDEIRIYSNSWGPVDNARDLVAPGFLTKSAIRRQSTQKNSIFVWAGGNGRQMGDNGNYDGYANHLHTLAVGAHNRQGKMAFYSEDCACLFVSAPSSGRHSSITTTDLHGMYGEENGDCRYDFGGTSSAAPLVAGIIADILQKHPSMGLRNIQHTLAKGCTRISPSYRDWSSNSRGYKHSHAYGFGHPDVFRLLQTADDYVTIPEEIVWKSNTKNHMQVIPKGNIQTTPFLLGGLDHALRIDFHPNPQSTHFDFVESVALELTYRHIRRGDIRVSLVSAEGVVSQLQLAHHDVNRDTPSGGWTYSSVRHWGEIPFGTWTLLIDDVGSSSMGHFLSARLIIHGHQTN